MEKAQTIGIGDKVKMKILLEPLYGQKNRIVCRYESGVETNEFSFQWEDLSEAYPDRRKLVLAKELIVEKVYSDWIECKVDGYNDSLRLAKDDIEI